MSSFEHVLLNKNEVVYVDRNDKKSKITVGELSPGDKILGAEGMYDVVVSDGHQVKEGTLKKFKVLPNLAEFQAARRRGIQGFIRFRVHARPIVCVCQWRVLIPYGRQAFH